MTSVKRSRTSLVNAFNIVPVVEQILPDRQKIEVQCSGAGGLASDVRGVVSS